MTFLISKQNAVKNRHLIIVEVLLKEVVGDQAQVVTRFLSLNHKPKAVH